MIQDIEDKEFGQSVTDKLNALIEKSNSLDPAEGNVYQGNGTGIEARSRENFGKQKELFSKSIITATGLSAANVWFYHSGQLSAAGATSDSGATLIDVGTLGRGVNWSLNPNPAFTSGFNYRCLYATSSAEKLLFVLYVDASNILEVTGDRGVFRVYQTLGGGARTLLGSIISPLLFSRLAISVEIGFHTANSKLYINSSNSGARGEVNYNSIFNTPVSIGFGVVESMCVYQAKTI